MRILILGMGGRGHHYLNFALQAGVEIAGLCDNDPVRIRRMREEFGLEGVPSWTDAGKAIEEAENVDAVVNSLPDFFHYDYTLQALAKGCHVLLEKPMATTAEECIGMVEAAEKANRHLMVCHVLRYAPLFEKVKSIVDQGLLGRILNFQLTENVGYWHYAHSFVRGLFSNTSHSAPFLLAKSCHDLDLISYITGKRCVSVMSEGGQFYFKPENAPEGAPERCTDGCPHEKTCPFFAPGFYLKQITQVGWPSNRIAENDSYNARLNALKTTNYGRCVFHAGNNVHDHEACLFVMEDGSTATFNLGGLSTENTRTFKLFGTEGDLEGNLDRNELFLGNYLHGTRAAVDLTETETIMSGHGGGDQRLFNDFVRLVRGEEDSNKGEARLSLQSHLMAFAAAISNEEGRRVYLSELIEKAHEAQEQK